jgi:hypothetical protein
VSVIQPVSQSSPPTLEERSCNALDLFAIDHGSIVHPLSLHLPSHTARMVQLREEHASPHLFLSQRQSYFEQL